MTLPAFGDRVYLLWGGGEGGNNLQACAVDGKKIWGVTPYLGYAGGGANAVVSDGKALYVAQWVGITIHDCADGHPIIFPGGKRGIDIPGGINGLALRNGHLYALSRGTVNDIQLDKGDDRAHAGRRGRRLLLKTAPGTEPALLFLRDGALCRLHLDTGVVDNLFPVELGKPCALAVSPDGKRIYISDQGRLQIDIRIFSYPQGKDLGTVGKPGGRPAIGKFDPNGLFMPGQMAFDSRGRLWVAEMDTSPNRFSVWQTTGNRGTFVKDFLGPVRPVGGHLRRSGTAGIRLYPEHALDRGLRQAHREAGLHLRASRLEWPAAGARAFRSGDLCGTCQRTHLPVRQ